MGKLNVKVRVEVLISHLEKAIAEREKRYAEQEKEQAKYEKEMLAYNAQIVKLVKSGKATVEEACLNHYHHYKQEKKRGYINATLSLPKTLVPTEPQRPENYYEHQYKHECDEIRQAIRVLKLTDDEFVSASTYASVAKYL